jgi:hypothetical protein
LFVLNSNHRISIKLQSRFTVQCLFRSLHRDTAQRRGFFFLPFGEIGRGLTVFSPAIGCRGWAEVFQSGIYGGIVFSLPEFLNDGLHHLQFKMHNVVLPVKQIAYI